MRVKAGGAHSPFILVANSFHFLQYKGSVRPDPQKGAGRGTKEEYMPLAYGERFNRLVTMNLDYARDIFPFVQKPSRYLGNEVNAIHKDLARVRSRVALAFPDTYEVGMSHNGIRILYHLLNADEDVAAERVFLPWNDFEAILRSKNALLSTLESRTPIREFHILGISLLYELAASNIVLLLDLAGIPRRAAQRRKEDPLVIGGGPVTFNVEPMAPFFDAVALGDGEELFPEVIRVHEKWRETNEPREMLLEMLEEIDGVYIPSRYVVEHDPSGEVKSFHHLSGHQEPVLARVLEDLNNSPHPTQPVIPYTQVVHDRVTLEVQRGCTRGCRFCHAGMVYRPVRDRDPHKVLELAEESLKNTGYEEISLSSLCIADYQPLKGLVPRLMERLAPMQTSISLPSLRVGAMSPDLLAQIARVRRTGFTLVPEAGSERLRNVINKVLTEADLRRNLQDILDTGWPGVKFYFMLGLPTENFDDLQEMADMLMSCMRMRSRKTGDPFRFINVSLSTFVPKPHTPFQWFPQNTKEEIKAKLDFIKRAVPDRRIKLNWSEPRHSFLEAVISKGDRRQADVIETAVDMGCKFDGWMEFFDYEKWMAAFETHGLDPEWYAYREIPEDAPLPWDHLDCGVTKEYQLADWRRSLREVTIGDCRYEACGQCGILDKYKGIKYHYEKPMPGMKSSLPIINGPAGMSDVPQAADLPPGQDVAPAELVELAIAKARPEPIHPKQRRRKNVARESGPVPVGFEGSHDDNPGLAEEQPDAPIRKFRFIYKKSGDLRFLSHLEILRTFIRAIQRAGYRLEHSKGFNPHPKIVFSYALPVGVESRAEVVDFSLLEINSRIELRDLFQNLKRELPRDLKPRSGWRIEGKTPSSANALSAATYEISLSRKDLDSSEALDSQIRTTIEDFMNEKSIEITREHKGKIKHFDARPSIIRFSLESSMDTVIRLHLTVRYGDGVKPKVTEILARCFGLSPEACLRARILKISIHWRAGTSRVIANAV